MPDKLEKYNKKRNFDNTKEPEGKAGGNSKTKEKLRFVVQHHLASRDHYDFRLEWEGTLLSWAVPKGPSYNPKDKRLAVRVEDHPLEYRHFEGTIPKGEYGGGTVMLWDEGYWEPYLDPEEGLNKGSLKFTLYGERLMGNWALARLNGKEGDKENWLLIKEKDGYAQDGDGISKFVTGVRSGLTMEEIERGDPPKPEKKTKSLTGDRKDTAEPAAVKNKIGGKKGTSNKSANPFSAAEPQLAVLVSSPPKDEGWIFEPKYDGYRIMAFAEGGEVRLISRGGKDFSKHFPEIRDALSDFAGERAAILDGEVVVTDSKGRSDFQALQNHMRSGKGERPTYAVFDILALNGEDLRGKPLYERKNILETFMRGARGYLYLSKALKGDGGENFKAACEHGLEGLVAKKADSFYAGRRSGDWVKIKCGKRQEFVIGGYLLTEKKTEGLSALLVGYYEGGKFVFAGRVGTGYTEKSRLELSEKFKPLIIQKHPFLEKPHIKIGETVYWLRPELVAEVQFAGWTGGNVLRQPSFKGLRVDKDPKTVIKEIEREVDEVDEMEKNNIKRKTDKKAPGGEVKDKVVPSEAAENPKEPVIGGIKISNPDKIIFSNPEVIKADIVRYYEKASDYMFKYAGGRILSIIRCPKGVKGSCFFKKHPGSPGKGITVMPVQGGSEEEDYFYISDPVGFISEAQMGTLEFHTWGSSVSAIEKPDMMVFDLDPDEGMSLDGVRQGVKDLKEILDELSLKSFLKVSGGKGYHIVVPFKPSAGWDTFNAFAKQIAGVMEKRFPDRYTTNMRKEKRKDKIFVDWVRNGRGATSVAPYSLRAREGASVAATISWDELYKVKPDGVSMAEAVSRLKGPDPWADFFEVGQKIKP